MNYTEWRDELKNNLLCVSENERRRVLDYYAEAYADRREAGFSEHEIIAGFGAPYDAAQRILAEKDVPYEEPPRPARNTQAAPPPPVYSQPQAYNPPPCSPPPAQNADNGNAVFIVLCVLLALPIFLLIVAMAITTLVLCLSPILTIACGGALIGAAIGTLFAGEVAYGFYTMGCGITAIGVGIALCPVFFKLTSMMWIAFKKLFALIKRSLNGKKECA